jgi:hypothetical protein
MNNFPVSLQVVLFAAEAVILLWIIYKSANLAKRETEEFLKKGR